jgi:hypothetical protein
LLLQRLGIGVISENSKAKLGILFLVGLLLGLNVALAWDRVSSASNTQEEYVALVATLYAREDMLDRAQERLTALETDDIPSTVAQIAAAFAQDHPERELMGHRLQNLSEALGASTGAPIVSSPTNPETPDATPAGEDESGLFTPLFILVALVAIAGLAVTLRQYLAGGRGHEPTEPSRKWSSTKPAVKRAPRPSHWKPVLSEDEGEGLSSIVSAPRPLNLDDPQPSLSAHISTDNEEVYKNPAASGRATAHYGTDTSHSKPLSPHLFIESVSEPRPLLSADLPEVNPRPLGDVSDPRPLAADERIEPVRDSSASSYPSAGQNETDREDRRQSNYPNQETNNQAEETSAKRGWSFSRGVESDSGWQPLPAAPAPRPRKQPRRDHEAEANAKTLILDCYYGMGDDPYDQIHPIYSPPSQVPAGACGVSSAMQIPGDDGCCAFTIWLHDYRSDDGVISVGVVSKWAETEISKDLQALARRERWQRVIVASDGLTINLESERLRAAVRLLGFDYLAERDFPRYAVFKELHVRFHTTIVP